MKAIWNDIVIAEADKQEHGVARDHPRQRREGGPPQHDSGQHPPRADPVGQGAGRNLEQAVGKEERAGHPSPLFGGDVQAFLDAGPGDRKRDAIDVGDDREQRQHPDDAVLILHLARDYSRVAELKLRLPEPLVNGAGFRREQRAHYDHRLRRPLEELSAGNQEIGTGERGELVAAETVDDGPNARPVHLAHAHRARLAAGVDDSLADLIARQLPDRRVYEVRLGMACRVSGREHRVLRRQEDLTVEDQKRAERVVAFGSRLGRE